MKYRRHFQAGGTYFFTLVSYNHRKIFTNESTVNILLDSIEKVRQNHPFGLIAYCILPDHLHMLCELQENDSDYPTKIRLIKSHFTRNWIDPYQIPVTPSRTSKKEKMVWQRRYWEHFIRDNRDFEKHIAYILYNPVKHELVHAPSEWKYSNCSDFVDNKIFAGDWGSQMNENDFANIGNE